MSGFETRYPDYWFHAQRMRRELAAKHERESATPMPDGTILADCACGATYSVPQGGDEYAALERERARHMKAAQS